MPVELNHSIVHSRDKRASSAFLARILGFGSPSAFGHFITVELGNGVSLDFDDAREIRPQHYAFFVDEEPAMRFSRASKRRPSPISPIQGTSGKTK